MAHNLKAIKDTLKSIKNIKKITKSMEIISAIKAQKANRFRDSSNQYLQIFKDDMKILLEDLKRKDSALLDNSPYTKSSEETEKNLFIVITSDRGLCSAYNTNIIKKTQEFIKENNFRGSELIGVGKKTILLTRTTDYFDGLKLLSLYEKVTEKVNWPTLKALIAEITNYYKSNHYKKVYVVYTKFESTFNFYPAVETLLPINKELFTDDLEDIEFEENPYLLDTAIEPLCEEYFEKYLEAMLYKLIIESSISEHFARMFTMKNADKSAKDLILNLSYEYNKSRQQKITQEVSEIMAGVNAQQTS